MAHVPVLLAAVVDGLGVRAGDILLDGTLGSGGHSAAVCERAGPSVTVVGIDRDRDALERARERFERLPNPTHFVLGEFRNLDQILERLGIPRVQAVLLDVGVSSPQIDDAGRGFSFAKDEPLLMTMGKDPGPEETTARDVVNDWSLESLEAVIRGYGEERYAGRIAQAIVAARERKPIERTGELVEVIRAAVPAAYRFGRIHPATRTFQAIRIAVNDELGNLSEALPKAFAALAPGGRLAVISFHSLEDRIVKRFMREEADRGAGTLVTKKPVTATEEETARNPRSRSAKLRIIQKR